MDAIRTATRPPPGLSGESDQKEEYARVEGRQWQVTAGHAELCAGCEDTIRQVMVCDNVSHALCQECDRKEEQEQASWSQPRTCRWCFKKKSSVDTVVRDALNQSLIQRANECTFHCVEAGCTWSGQYNDIPQHSGQCVAHIYHCKFQQYGCQERDTEDELSRHVLNCKYRERICQQCQQHYSITQAEQHAESCPEQLETSAITLPKSSWQLLEPMDQWSDLAPDAQQSIMQTTVKMLTQAQKLTLASAIAKRTRINTLCKFGCGAILEHPTQLTEHYQSECPNGLTSCRHCQLECLRQDLGKHYEHCLQRPVNCPWACGKVITRANLQDGSHKSWCDGVITQCAHCGQSDTKAVIKIHQRSCGLAPWTCQFCNHTTRLSEQATHQKICPEIRPFQLAGYQYSLQPDASALIYQRTDEAIASHVCIPTTQAVLQAWKHDNPVGLEHHLRIPRQSCFTFHLGQTPLECYFCKKGKLRSKVDNNQIVHMYYVDAKGQELGDIFSGCRSDYALGFLGESSVYYNLKGDLADNTPVFLIISLVPHACLFDSPPRE